MKPYRFTRAGRKEEKIDWTDELLVQAYHDGELPDDLRPELERRLQGDPALAARLDALRALSTLIERDRRNLPPPPAPVLILPGEIRPVRGPFRPLPLTLAAAAALVLVIGIGSVIFSRGYGSAGAFAGGRDNQPHPDILSIDLPQEGTGAMVYYLPESETTILWVSGLTLPSQSAPELEEPS